MLIEDDVPNSTFCQTRVPHTKHMSDELRYHLCERKSPWVPSAPNFIGGPTTGAKKE